MAGIGFQLDRMIKKRSFLEKASACVYSVFVFTGPWLLFFISFYFSLSIVNDFYPDQTDLIVGSMIYIIVFSQIFTSPFQIFITRYISDILYKGTYNLILSSYVGISKIISIITFLAAVIFFSFSKLPLNLKFVTTLLFLIFSLIWIINIYLGTLKGFKPVLKAYFMGALISTSLNYILVRFPLPFDSYQIEINFLVAFLMGMTVVFISLTNYLYSSFITSNFAQYDYLKNIYFHKPLIFIGIFYFIGLWIDNIIMWNSSLGVSIASTYRYSPLYDGAAFYAYLLQIPATVISILVIEISLYGDYKKYFDLANGSGRLDELGVASKVLFREIFKKLIFYLILMFTLSITGFLIGRSLLVYFGENILLIEIFSRYIFGVMCNMLLFNTILILFYLDLKKDILISTMIFAVLNSFLTYYIMILDKVEYFAFGYVISSFVAFLFTVFFLYRGLKNININTFLKKDLTHFYSNDFFYILSNKLDNNNFKKLRKKYQSKVEMFQDEFD